MTQLVKNNKNKNKQTKLHKIKNFLLDKRKSAYN